MEKIIFLSNHKDTGTLKDILIKKGLKNPNVVHLAHPYIEPEWTTEEVKENCKFVIELAVNAEHLIMNGDYTLVSVIVLERRKLGKKTGFITMKKLSSPDGAKKQKDGSIKHSNILLPVNIRYI